VKLIDRGSGRGSEGKMKSGTRGNCRGGQFQAEFVLAGLISVSYRCDVLEHAVVAERLQSAIIQGLRCGKISDRQRDVMQHVWWADLVGLT
jgi:hypothetical protein